MVRMEVPNDVGGRAAVADAALADDAPSHIELRRNETRVLPDPRRRVVGHSQHSRHRLWKHKCTPRAFLLGKHRTNAQQASNNNGGVRWVARGQAADNEEQMIWSSS